MGDVRGSGSVGDGEGPDRSDTSERLVRAAFEAFVAVGFEETRVQDIAKAAGFTTGAIYRHFENKAALLSAAMRLYGASFLDGALGRLVVEHDIDTMIDLGTDSLAGPATDLHRVLTDVSAIAVRDPQVRGALGDLLDDVRSAFVQAIEGAQADGDIDPTMPAGAIVDTVLTLMVGSFVVKALGLSQAEELEARVVMDRMVRSLEPRPAQGP